MSRSRAGPVAPPPAGAGPPYDADDEDGRETGLLVARLRLGLWILLAAWAVFLLLELFLLRERPLPVLAIKTAQLAALLAALGLLRPGVSRAFAIAVGLAAASVVCLTSALTGVVADEVSSSALLAIVLVVATAGLVPWGVRAQAWTAVAAVASLAANAWLVSRLPADLGFSATVVAIAVVASLAVALETEREQRRRFRATRALRESEHRKSAVVDASPDCVVVLDGAATILEWNAAAGRILGLAGDGMPGARLGDLLVAPGGRDVQREAIERDLRAGAGPMIGRRIEATVRRADGNPSPAEITITPLAGAEPALFTAYVRDLTDLRQAQQNSAERAARARTDDALAQTRRFVDQVADATPHILYLYDVAEGRVVYVNRQVARVLGYSSEDVQRHGVEFLLGVIHPDDVASTIEGARERLADIPEDGVVEAELRVRHRDGGWRWIHCRNIVFTRGADGAPAQILGTAQDVTERKRADELLRAHEAELAHTLRVSTLGEMAAGIAHELNQPLASIVGFAKGCARRLRGGIADPEAFAVVMEQIASEALRAGEIIRRLRTLVRKEEPTRDTTDPNALVADTARLLEPEARRLGVRLDLRLAAGLPPIEVDRIQIEQVLLNLVRNGCEAMEDLPEEERVLTLLTSSGGPDAVILAVHDRGKGLGEAGPERIFDPFFTTKTTGLGMGLAISRSIAERHGGRLLVIANHDRGATFQLVLPCAGAGDVAPGDAPAATDGRTR